MKPPKELMNTWGKFADFPMETLTKVWFYKQGTEKKQRDVSLMKKHREQYGLAGNCFDLAIWLLDELEKNRITAYPIKNHGHAAVVALDQQGQRYLCDLGDQWLSPILIEKDSIDYTNERLSQFFPAADVEIYPEGERVTVFYHRPNGRASKQIYELTPISMTEFLVAAEKSQNQLNREPLFECRVPYGNEIGHWEFSHWESFLSTTTGIIKDPPLKTLADWVERLYERSAYNKEILKAVLEFYKCSFTSSNSHSS